MDIIPKEVKNLIKILTEIPGIGNKTAERIAIYLITSKDNLIDKFLTTFQSVKDNIKTCSECGMISDSDPCKVCSSPERNKNVICIVEHPTDVIVIEKTGEFNGVYHILGGVISPIEGIGPGDLNIDKLIDRINKYNVEEIFIALDPDAEGETTTSFLVSIIRKVNPNISITSIAKGIPLGGNIEYSDLLTLSRAIKFRNKIEF
ncbi:MAG: recombination mediator RecR [Brevinematia bacterium]